MSTLLVLNGSGNPIYVLGDGSGTASDPFVPTKDCRQSGAWSFALTNLPSPLNVTIQNPVVGVSGFPTVLQGGAWSTTVLNPTTVVGISGQPTFSVANPTTVIGISGIPTVQLAAGQSISLAPVTTGGTSSYRSSWPNSSTAVAVKGSAGNLYGYSLFNRGGAEKFVKLYNSASATTGSTVPVQVYWLAPSGGANMSWAIGLDFSTGISVAVTAGGLDTDTTAPASGDVIVNLSFK